MRITKTQRLIDHMRAGDWSRALSLANTFRMLGQHRDTIRLAHECRAHPRFYRGLGRDPATAVAAGIAALQRLYPERKPTMPRSPEHVCRIVRQLIDEGVTPQQIATAIFEECSEDARTTEAERERARAEYAEPSNDAIEIDDTAMASRDDDGLWVQAWLWLPNEEHAA